MIELSIAAGDPLQPGGLSEYLAATRKPAPPKAKRAQPKPAKAAPALPEDPRTSALRAAHARWTKRTKG